MARTIKNMFFFFSLSRVRLRFFFVKKHLQNYVSSTSSHLHLCTSIYIFTCSHLHIYIFTYISAHLHVFTCSHLHESTFSHFHICTSTSSLHIYIITAHLHLCSSSHLHIYISAHLRILTSAHLHLSLFFSFSLKAGGGAAGAPRNATLCGDRACRGREMQVRLRFGPVAGTDCVLAWSRDFWRKSRTKRSFWRLGASLLEEVSYEALVLETWRFTFGGSLVRSAGFGDLAFHFWRKSRTKRSFWRLGASLVELDSDLAANVVRERAFRSWAQKWAVCRANVVRESGQL